MPRKPRQAPVERVPAAPAARIPEPPPAPPVAPDFTVTNCLPGTQLHLGDGRVLAFGESAEVGETMAAFLRGRGQAR